MSMRSDAKRLQTNWTSVSKLPRSRHRDEHSKKTVIVLNINRTRDAENRSLFFPTPQKKQKDAGPAEKNSLITRARF